MPENPETLREVGIRLGHLEKSVAEYGGHAAKSLDDITTKLNELEKNNRQDYIRKETFEARFRPIERLVYGMVALILAAFLGAIWAVVVK